MNMYEKLNLPHSCQCIVPIYKKTLLERSGVSAADKKLIKRLARITWLYCIKPETVNIPIFKNEIREYTEIQIIEVEIAEANSSGEFKNTELRRVAEILARAIPYPTIIIMRHGERFQFWTSHSRNNPADPGGAVVLDSFVSTDWLEESTAFLNRISLEKMRTGNLYDLYSNYVDEITLFNAQQRGISGGRQAALTPLQAKHLLERIDQLESEKSRLISAVKAESQYNRKAELNIQIKRIEKEITKTRE